MSLVWLHPDDLGVRGSSDGSPPPVPAGLPFRPQRLQQRAPVHLTPARSAPTAAADS